MTMIPSISKPLLLFFVFLVCAPALEFCANLSAQTKESGPQAKQDGWPTADASSVGISSGRLHPMEALIRSGELKKITSVLIARHGKLAYETYFDGDADTLTNT